MLLTEEQRLVRDTIRSFAQTELAPNAARWDREHCFPREALHALGALGALGMVVPERYGGAAMDYVSLAVALEEIAAGDGATSTIVSVQNSVVCGPLNAFGTDAQKEKYLKPLARGERFGCFCLTEPQVGSDAGAIATRAERDGDAWVLNGVKQFITTGKNADVAIVFAVTDKAGGKKGISAFVVDTSTPGLRRRARRGEARPARVRHRADHVRELPRARREPARPRGRRLPDRARESRGRPHRHRRAGGGNGEGGARGGARVRARPDRVRQGDRRSTRRSTSSSPTWRREIEAARQLVWHAAALRDAGEPCLKEASMAKLFASEMAERVCSDAIQIHGGYGYVADFPVERIYRDVRVCQIYEGTSEIQRLVIGRALAG